MRIIQDTQEFQFRNKTAVTIGKFDGIHIGHRQLLHKIMGKKKDGYDTCVFTFSPSPAVFFGTGSEKELTTKEEKRRLFEKMGIDILVEFPLNEETAAIPPDFFVDEILVRQMKAEYIVAGADVTFGDKGLGNGKLLKEKSKKHGYTLEIIDKICIQNVEVSSSYVREAVASGNMELAAQLLGYPYSIYGEVVHGNKIGRTIGMPTLNQFPPQDKLLPPRGVYYSEVEIEGKVFKGITNIGFKPTVEDKQIMGVETFLYNFNQSIYGNMVDVRLFQFKRPEMKFMGIEELKKQLKSDIEEGSTFRGDARDHVQIGEQ